MKKKNVEIIDILGGFIVNEDGTYLAICGYESAEAAADKYADEHDIEIHAYYYMNGWEEMSENLLNWYKGRLDEYDKNHLEALMGD